MSPPARTSTRDIARAAVRANLAQVAFDLFRREGFDEVTVNDVAAAAGVSRSTFLRYFGTKEEAVLSALDPHETQVPDALRARPASEDGWTALRRALDPLIEHYHQDKAAALAVAQLINQTPALRTRNMEKQANLRPVLAQILAERADPPQSALAPLVLTAAALDCMTIAVDHWTASDGHQDLAGLLDEAFAVLAPR